MSLLWILRDSTLCCHVQGWQSDAPTERQEQIVVRATDEKTSMFKRFLQHHA